MKDRFFSNRSDEGRQKGSRRQGRVPPWLLAGLLLLAGVGPGPTSAQPAKVKAARPSDRCLLIVETSKAMQRRIDGTLRAVEDLLRSGRNGEFRDGGTLGVWTFNEDLFTGRFPLQTWSSAAQQDVIRRTVSFLKAQKLEKQANFDKVAPALARVVKDSELITVIVVSSGDSPIRGTPFDDRINAAFRQGRDQQRKARMPFITILRARKGELGAYAVNTPPWPVLLPQLAEETNSTAQAHARLIEALYNPPTSTVPPLIISGKKPSPNPEVAKATNAMPSSSLAAAVTNKSASFKQSESVKAGPGEGGMAEVPPSAVVSQRKTEGAAALPPKASLVAPIKLEPAPVPISAEPKASPKGVEGATPDASPGPKVGSAPAASVTNQAQPAVPGQAVATQPAPSNVSSGNATLSSRPTPPAQAATATPAQSLGQSRNILIAGLLLAVVAIGTALVIIRRSRGSARGSLITRSFERENKP